MSNSATLSPKLKERLDDSWAGLFYREIFVLLDEKPFETLYLDMAFRPTIPLNVLLGLEILKSNFGWSDEDMYENFCYNLQIRYALGYHQLDEGHLDLQIVYNFRQRLNKHLEKNGEDLIAQAFEPIPDEQLAAFTQNTNKLQIEPDQVVYNIRQFCRFQPLVDTLKRVYQDLSETAKQQRYGLDFEPYLQISSEQFVYQIKSHKYAKHLERIGQLMSRLVSELAITHADQSSYQMLVRVFNKHFVIGQDNHLHARSKDELSSEGMHPTEDLGGAAYRQKRRELSLRRAQADEGTFSIYQWLSITALRHFLTYLYIKRTDLLINGFLPIVLGLGMGGFLLYTQTLDSKWSMVSLIAVAGVVFVLIVDMIYDSTDTKKDYLKKFLLIAIMIDVPLGFDIAPGTIESHQGGPAGLEISLMTFAIVLGYALWFIDKRSSDIKGKAIYYCPMITVPALLFLGSNLLSFFQSQYWVFSRFEMIMTLQFFLFYFYFINYLEDESDLKLVMTTLVVTMILQSLLMCAQYFAGFEFDIGILKTASQIEDDGSTRVGGTLGGASGAGTWIMATLITTIGLLLDKHQMVNRKLAIAGTGIGLIAIMTTGSRGGWLALAMGIILIGIGIALSERLRESIDKRMVMFAVVGGVLIAPIIAGPIIQRFTADDGGSAESRKPLAALAMNIIEDNPFGIGLNTYGEEMFSSRYVPPSLVGSSSIYVVHNKYLLVWAETGPWGLAFFVLLILAGLGTTIRLYFNLKTPPYLVILSLTVFASLIGYAQNMNSEPFGTRQRAELMWVFLAMLAGIYKLATINIEQEEEFVEQVAIPNQVINYTPNVTSTNGAAH